MCPDLGPQLLGDVVDRDETDNAKHAFPVHGEQGISRCIHYEFREPPGCKHPLVDKKSRERQVEPQARRMEPVHRHHYEAQEK